MKKRRPRRTNEEITQAIHAAVISLAKEKSFGKLTFERVARRSRTSKSVLYRRYSNRADMFLDAICSKRSGVKFPEPTGVLRDDLLAWFEAYQKAWFARPADYRGLIGEASDETLAKITEFETSVASLMMEKIIRPAKARFDLGFFDIEEALVLVPFRVLRDRFIFGGALINMELFTGVFIASIEVRSGWTPAYKDRHLKELKDRRNAEAKQAREESDSDSPDL